VVGRNGSSQFVSTSIRAVWFSAMLKSPFRICKRLPLKDSFLQILLQVEGPNALLVLRNRVAISCGLHKKPDSPHNEASNLAKRKGYIEAALVCDETERQMVFRRQALKFRSNYRARETISRRPPHLSWSCTNSSRTGKTASMYGHTHR
jgi:hypothetical protein